MSRILCTSTFCTFPNFTGCARHCFKKTVFLILDAIHMLIQKNSQYISHHPCIITVTVGVLQTLDTCDRTGCLTFLQQGVKISQNETHQHRQSWWVFLFPFSFRNCFSECADFVKKHITISGTLTGIQDVFQCISRQQIQKKYVLLVGGGALHWRCWTPHTLFVVNIRMFRRLIHAAIHWTAFTPHLNSEQCFLPSVFITVMPHTEKVPVLPEINHTHTNFTFPHFAVFILSQPSCSLTHCLTILWYQQFKIYTQMPSNSVLLIKGTFGVAFVVFTMSSFFQVSNSLLFILGFDVTAMLITCSIEIEVQHLYSQNTHCQTNASSPCRPPIYHEVVFEITSWQQ
jgi:hypothetical protein